MPVVHTTLHKGRVPAHIYTDEIDHSALLQLQNIASLPIVHPHVDLIIKSVKPRIQSPRRHVRHAAS